MENETLGVADRILQTVLQYRDHAVHNRPGVVRTDASTPVGVRWDPVTTREEEGGRKGVFLLTQTGRRGRPTETRIGHLSSDGKVRDSRTVVGRFQSPGIFPEVVAWVYQQIAEVWKLDNEFAARWASYAFNQEKNKDMRVILAAFMLVQSRKGDPVREGGKVIFFDEDYRDVGEAMALLSPKDAAYFDPKLLLRVGEVLSVPAVAAINRDLGFGRSARKAPLGRWPKVVEKYLRHRETNPRMLEGQVKAGFRSTLIQLARKVGYKPESPKFFEILRWKQTQSEDGRRAMAIGQALTKADSWDDLTEEQICERIEAEKPNFKRIVGRLPSSTGLTRAIMAAAIEAGALSNKDLIIATPTLEDLGLLEVQTIRERWETAGREADDQRARNIARNVQARELRDKLEESADTVVQNAVEEQVRGLVVYVLVDISGSMEGAIEEAKRYLSKFVHAFPPDKLHVVVFNTVAREVNIPHRSEAGVNAAFRGIRAGGGTSYGSGVRRLQDHKPAADEDALLIFVGDEQQGGNFADQVRASGLNPVAFGLVRVVSAGWGDSGEVVRVTAARLGIPCFQLDNRILSGDDPYAIPQMLRNLVASTPVGQNTVRAIPRVTLAEQILQTNLLTKPAWAA